MIEEHRLIDHRRSCDPLDKPRLKKLQVSGTNGSRREESASCRGGAPFAIGSLMTPQELRDRLDAFAVQADALASPLLASPVTRNSADQLIRSSSSAASHHRAAGRARSHAEFTVKLGTALEEADEALAWIKHLVACGRVPPGDADPLIAKAVELVKILTSSCRTAQRNEEARRRLDRAQTKSRR